MNIAKVSGEVKAKVSAEVGYSRGLKSKIGFGLRLVYVKFQVSKIVKKQIGAFTWAQIRIINH